MTYVQLEEGDIESLVYRDRPRWVTCAAFAAAVLIISACAVSVGLVMGYTYSYLEYRSVLRSMNASESDILHLMQLSYLPLVNANTTFNGAIARSGLVSRILTLGHTLMEEKAKYLSWVNEEDNHNGSRYYRDSS